LIFNQVLSKRVANSTWDRALPGEALNLDGGNSVFVADEETPALQARLAAMDLHPTGPLWGCGESLCRGLAAELETAQAESCASLSMGLASAGVRQARRALRLPVRDLRCDLGASALQLKFSLVRGGYATAVLREIVAVN
jgi:tRNA pseudouridine13 synthase